MQVHSLNTLPFTHSPAGCMEVSTGERRANSALHAASLFVAEFVGAAVSVFPFLAGSSSRTATVCSHSALVSTQPIVSTYKHTFVLLVPKPHLFRPQH